MKTVKIRSMRDIPTIQGLRNRSVPGSREQIMSELARLEHEKARLHRELDIWIANQKKTEDRLRQVQERVALLQKVMDESDPRHKAEDETDTDRWREVSLEY